MAQFSGSPSRIMSRLRCRAWFGEGFGVDWNSVPNRKPYNKRGLQCRPLFSLSKKYYFNFYASCGSTHKIEFAEQIHKFREHGPDHPLLPLCGNSPCVSRNLYKGRKNVPARRGFSSEFDRKRGFDREAARKTLVFRQPQTAVQSYSGLSIVYFTCGSWRNRGKPCCLSRSSRGSA